MSGLFSSLPLAWDQPAAVAGAGQSLLTTDGADGALTGTLGRLGSSYLDADCMLASCPSRDTFLLPDDLEEPPVAPQHSLSTPSTVFPPTSCSQPTPAGPQAGSAACRTTPARPSTAGAGIAVHRTAGGPAQVALNSSSTWDRFGTGMALNSTAYSSNRASAHSPLMSARTVAALMAGEDDLQAASMDLLGLDGTLSPLESDLLWGAGAQLLTDSAPAAGSSSPAGQQHHQQQQQQAQYQQQLRVLGASPMGGLRGGQVLSGGAAAVHNAPTGISRERSTAANTYHPQYQHQGYRQQAFSQQQQQQRQQQQRHMHQQWQVVHTAPWQQQQQQYMQQAYLQPQQRQQLGAQNCSQPPAGHSGGVQPVARVLMHTGSHPGLQAGRTSNAGGQLQQSQQQQQHQQQALLQAQARHQPQMQQQQGTRGSPRHWQGSTAAAAAAAVNSSSNAAAQAALHTWGSNSSSLTAAVDAAGSPNAGVCTTDTPTGSIAAAGAAAAGVATAGSGTLPMQPAGLVAISADAAAEAAAAAPNAAYGTALGPFDASSPAIPGTTAAAAAGTDTETQAQASAGSLAAAAAAASPDKGPASAAGVVSLSSANSGSMGDSSHDSSQTQQQDAGSTERPTTDPPSGAAAAGADTAGPTDAAAAAAAGGGRAGGGGAEGVVDVPQPRVFHHKGGGPCDHCGVMESPQWRRGPPAKPILCNACGTRFRRTHHLGPPIPSSGRIGGPRPLVPGSLARSGSGSSGGSTPGRKRAAAAEALGPAPLPVNFDGGVHTGTRLARNPSRPLPKQYKVEDL